MTTGNNHLLQKVTFEIGLHQQDGAFEIQNRISNAFRSGILQRVEELFDRISKHGEVITIDKIEINLGHLNSAQLEEDLTRAVEKELEGFLASVENEIQQIKNHVDKTEVNLSSRASPTVSSREIKVRWPVPNNPHFEARIIVANDSVSHFEKVTYLLEFGIFPVAWTSPGSTRLPDLISTVFNEHPEQLAAFIRSKQKNQRVLQRIVLNAQRDQLQYLAALLGCRFSFELPDLISQLLTLISARTISISDFKQQNELRFTETEQFIWFRILEYYARRDESHTPVPAFASDDKVILAVRLLLTEPRLLSRIFDAQAGAFTQAQQKSWTVLAPALDIIATGLLPEPESIWKVKRTPSELKKAEELSSLVHAPISADEIREALQKEQQDTPSILRKEDQSASEEPIEVDLGLYINNAGLIILAPYLKPFFENSGLLEENQFRSTEAAHKAIHLLQYACGFEHDTDFEGYSENEMVFNKILCGVDVAEPVPEKMELTEKDRNEVDALLQAILRNWTVMQRSSVYALQRTFFQKQGRLSKSGPNWDMLVERDSAVEILIDKLPWAISLIKLPWNDYTINTQW